MSQHTPGPWETFNSRKRAVVGVDAVNSPHRIASLNVAGKEPQEVEANGRLIAAAPDLLAAAVDAQSLLESLDAGVDIATGPTSQVSAVVQALNAAIAKATGPV